MFCNVTKHIYFLHIQHHGGRYSHPVSNMTPTMLEMQKIHVSVMLETLMTAVVSKKIFSAELQLTPAVSILVF